MSSGPSSASRNSARWRLQQTRLRCDRGGGDGPRASHVPFVRRRDGRVIVQIHFTAKNPLVELADGARRFLLIVAGDDAYISNDWYASRDNVSTWLYEAVHLSGVAHLRGRDENRGHGDALLAVSEARLPKQPVRLQGHRRPGSAHETANTLWPALLGGVNFMLHAAGWLEGGLVSSYEKFIIDADQLRPCSSALSGRPPSLSENGQGPGRRSAKGPGLAFPRLRPHPGLISRPPSGASRPSPTTIPSSSGATTAARTSSRARQRDLEADAARI